MQENLLYDHWLRLARGGRLLVNSGHRLRVLSAGRLNLREGPDFQHARFILDGVLYQGAVEIHRREEEWYAHGHHLDERYAAVQLHMVAPGSRASGVRHNGHGYAIPTMVLPPPVVPSRPRCRPGGAIGEERWRALAWQRQRLRIRAMLAALAVSPPEDVFYTQLLRALGYGGNSDTFELLARRVPWRQAQALRHRPARLWELYDQQAAPLPWRRGGLRPVSRAEQGVALICHWMTRHGLPELYERVNDLLRRRLPRAALLKALAALLRPVSPAPLFPVTPRLGRGRVIEMAGNVFIPLEYAGAAGSAGYRLYLRELFHSLPLPALYGVLKRQPAFSAYPPPRRFYQGQALLHVWHGYCRAGGCAVCPLGHRPSLRAEAAPLS